MPDTECDLQENDTDDKNDLWTLYRPVCTQSPVHGQILLIAGILELLVLGTSLLARWHTPGLYMVFKGFPIHLCSAV